jgi:hypothetical protein
MWGFVLGIEIWQSSLCTVDFKSSKSRFKKSAEKCSVIRSTLLGVQTTCLQKEGMQNKLYRTVKGNSVVIHTVVLALVCGLSSISIGAHAEDNPRHKSPRIDVPVTPANSVLYDFGCGGFLRVPKFLLSADRIPVDPMQPISGGQLSMVFLYPDMVLTSYPDAVDRILEQHGSHLLTELKPNLNRFPVHIKWIFYAPTVCGNETAENVNHGLDQRPSRKLRDLDSHVKESGKLHQLPDAKITFTDAKYLGLREVHIPVTDKEYQERAEKVWRAHGWKGGRDTLYVERVGSSYELYMNCQSTICTAYVYIKRNRFQYQMIFLPQAAANTDALIKTINKLVDSWVQQ